MRWLALAGGLAGAACLSQYPEFAQQYVQRLGGTVDALAGVVADFDRTARNAGLTRDAALGELEGTPFLDARQQDMTATFRRYERLSADLTMLRLAGPVERMTLPQRMADPATLSATWGDFRPAMPLTQAGGVAAAAGFSAGWLALAGLLRALGWPFRRRRAGLDATRRARENRAEPPVSRA